MEEIRFVVTPPCSECKTPLALKGRYCCLGCERQRQKKITQSKAFSHRLKKSEQLMRNKKIFEMRKAGLSYSYIAQKLKMPRATVQSAAAAAKTSADLNCQKTA